MGTYVKRHFPSQTTRKQKPTDLAATCLGTAETTCALEEPMRICSRICQRLAFGKWNVLSLTGKEQGLVQEAKRYRLDTVGISSTKHRGFETVRLDENSSTRVNPTVFAQASMGIFTSGTRNGIYDPTRDDLYFLFSTTLYKTR